VRLEGFESDAPHRFLMVLKGSWTFIPVFVDQKRVPAPPPLHYEFAPKDEALNKQAQETFVSHMRGLADEWINTGRDASGEGEEPGKRMLTTGLKRIMSEWAAGNRPDIRFDESGELVVSMPVRKVNFTGDGVPIGPLDAAKQEAVRWFAGFLDSPYAYRLCKCRSCNEYYYTERRAKGWIEYGTYCPRHRHLASAMRSYEARQAPAQERRLDVAAQYWGKWPKSMSTDECKQLQWIAKKVNENVSLKWTPIRRNWVTLHGAEIETRNRALRGTLPHTARVKAAEGRIHAEG